MAVIAMVGIAQAEVTMGVDENATWLGYAHAFNTPAEGGGWLWGSGWATEALPATIGGGVATISPNTNTYEENAADPYWVDQTTLLGNKVMEMNFYSEEWGLIGFSRNRNDSIYFHLLRFKDSIPRWAMPDCTIVLLRLTIIGRWTK